MEWIVKILEGITGAGTEFLSMIGQFLAQIPTFFFTTTGEGATATISITPVGALTALGLAGSAVGFCIRWVRSLFKLRSL